MIDFSFTLALLESGKRYGGGYGEYNRAWAGRSVHQQGHNDVACLLYDQVNGLVKREELAFALFFTAETRRGLRRRKGFLLGVGGVL
jgi:hypothetical protein